MISSPKRFLNASGVSANAGDLFVANDPGRPTSPHRDGASGDPGSTRQGATGHPRRSRDQLSSATKGVDVSQDGAEYRSRSVAWPWRRDWGLYPLAQATEVRSRNRQRRPRLKRAVPDRTPSRTTHCTHTMPPPTRTAPKRRRPRPPAQPWERGTARPPATPAPLNWPVQNVSALDVVSNGSPSESPRARPALCGREPPVESCVILPAEVLLVVGTRRRSSVGLSRRLGLVGLSG